MSVPSITETRTLTVSVQESVFDLIPDYRRLIVLAVKSGPADAPALVQGLSAANAAVRARGEHDVTLNSALALWRAAFRAVGMNPTKTRPAVEALTKRARGGGIGSLGLPAVDVGTIVTLLRLMPVGVHVLDEVFDELTLAPATGEETFITFQGEPESPDPGEIVWCCGRRVLTRRWVHKQGRFGSVTDSAKVFAINLDALGEADLPAARETLVKWLAPAGMTMLDSVELSATTPLGHLEVPAVLI